MHWSSRMGNTSRWKLMASASSREMGRIGASGLSAGCGAAFASTAASGAGASVSGPAGVSAAGSAGAGSSGVPRRVQQAQVRRCLRCRSWRRFVGCLRAGHKQARRSLSGSAYASGAGSGRFRFRFRALVQARPPRFRFGRGFRRWGRFGHRRRFGRRGRGRRHRLGRLGRRAHHGGSEAGYTPACRPGARSE